MADHEKISGNGKILGWEGNDFYIKLDNGRTVCLKDAKIVNYDMGLRSSNDIEIKTIQYA